MKDGYGLGKDGFGLGSEGYGLGKIAYSGKAILVSKEGWDD